MRLKNLIALTFLITCNAQAQYKLGEIFMIDGDTNEETIKGVALIRHAAEQNLAEAQVMLGNIHGVRQEFDESAK